MHVTSVTKACYKGMLQVFLMNHNQLRVEIILIMLEKKKNKEDFDKLRYGFSKSKIKDIKKNRYGIKKTQKISLSQK